LAYCWAKEWLLPQLQCYAELLNEGCKLFSLSQSVEGLGAQ